MSYKVLARTYRPQRFEGLIGQEVIGRTLSNAIAADRVHHAYLFCGPRGVGKTSAARILAMALNCETGPRPDPCGACEPCLEIAEGRALDVREIDGASHNGVDHVRQLQETAYTRPARRCRIFIIDEVHMLTNQAFNALLKLLEEPPPSVHFIFATTEPHKVLDTIKSRCQQHDFRRIPTRRIVEQLEVVIGAEGLAVERSALRLVAAAADGGMRDALSLLEQVIAYTSGAVDGAIAAECLGLVDRRAVLTLLHAVAQGERADALTQLDTLYSSGSDLRRFADTLVAEVRGLLICAEVDDPGSLLDLDPEAIEQAVDRGRALGPTHLRRWLRLALDGAAEIARSGHPRTVLELMILRLADAAGMVPLAELLERLEAGGSVATPPAPGRRAAPLPRPVAPEEKPLRRPQAVAAPKPDAAPKTAPKAAAPPRREAVPSAPFLHALAASSQPLAATLATASLREHQGCLSGRLDAARAAIVRQDRSRHDIAAALAATGLKSLQIGDLLIEARAAEQILQPPEPVVDPAPPIEKPIEKPITSATAPEFSSLPDLDEADRARLAGWAAIYPTLPAPLRGRLVPFVPIAQEGTMLLLASETAGLADAEEAEVASAKVEAEGVTGLRIVRPEPTQLALLRAMLRQQRADRDPVFRERLALRQHETTQAVMTLFNATVDEVGL